MGLNALPYNRGGPARPMSRRRIFASGMPARGATNPSVTTPSVTSLLSNSASGGSPLFAVA